MLKNTKSNASGFTLVELLIVIVIIAILAVLTLVGVNGYISRANDSKVKDSAGQLRTKVEAWNSIKTTYPAYSDVSGGLSDTSVPEAKLNDSIKNLLTSSETTAPTGADDGKALQYATCSTGGSVTGAKIIYWQKAAPQTITMGDGC